MLNGHRVGGLLLMGGGGKRFGSETPKQFHRLSGKPVYQITLEIFLATGFFDEIVLSCHTDWIDIVKRDLASMNIPIAIRVVPGAATRQQSSYNGLLAFTEPPSVVLIHDAVRPFVSYEILHTNVLMAIAHGAVDTCISSADTLIHSSDQRFIASIPDRSQLFRGQTPQSFSYSLILEAHRKTKRTDATDDCQLVLESGHPVFIAKGDENNLKITSELDLFLAEQLFRLRFTGPPAGNAVSLAGKRYAVVGGTGGIGSAICRLIEEKGGVAIALSRKTVIPLDMRCFTSIQQAFAAVGPLDGLINSAGLFRTGDLAMLALADIEALLDVNLKGLILCCQLAELKAGGRLINIASSSFARGRKGSSIYSCAKAAVVNFTQALAEERPDLCVHAIIPQRTRTPMRQNNFPGEDAATLLDPQQVAEAVIGLLIGSPLSTGLLVEIRNK